MKFITTSFLILMTLSCSHLNSVSQTSIPKDRSHIVEAKVENNIIFLLNFSNEYLDQITQKLMDQCPNGSVTGILTKDENITYFPIIFHKNIVTAKGYCIEETKKTKKRR